MLNSRKICRYISVAANEKMLIEKKSDILRKDAVKIFKSGISSVNPCTMLGNVLKYNEEQSTLEVNGQQYHLNNNIFLIGMGSASLGMFKAVENVLEKHIVSGVISIPHRLQEDLKISGVSELSNGLPQSSKIQICEGAQNNKVDEAALNAGKAIQSLASKLSDKDILLVFISGGGTALCPVPYSPITWQELRKVHKLLGRGGATENELNTILQNLEILKGGGLAREAQPAKIISFILSYLEGDPISLIAGGSTVHTDPSPNYSLRILERLGLMSEIPDSVKCHLEEQAKQQSRDLAYEMKRSLPKRSKVEPMWANVQNVIVGNNILALKGCESKAKKMGYCPIVMDKVFHGEAKEIGKLIAKLMKFIMVCFDQTASSVICPITARLEVELIAGGIDKIAINKIVSKIEEANSTDKDVCLVASGNLFVHVTGNGVGGQCSEMAAASAVQMSEDLYDYIDRFQFCALMGDSYGKDGTTQVTGSLVDGELLVSMKDMKPQMEAYLSNNDTFTALSQVNKGKNMFTIHMTGTDVMDMFVMLVQRPQEKKFSYEDRQAVAY